ncbi:MAG: alpha/beta hydrolase, partial [Clostridia bacterium]|nr:alpha/beta hydrolase [Clostridia bacterium]
MEVEKIYLEKDNPEVFLEAYIADENSSSVRKAILIIPGGAYGKVEANREGEPIAMAFLERGYNAFVLHYTVGLKKPFPAQLIEASMAV